LRNIILRIEFQIKEKIRHERQQGSQRRTFFSFSNVRLSTGVGGIGQSAWKLSKTGWEGKKKSMPKDVKRQQILKGRLRLLRRREEVSFS